MKSALERIAEERQRQISAEGWTPEHDDEHSDGALIVAEIERLDRKDARALD